MSIPDPLVNILLSHPDCEVKYEYNEQAVSRFSEIIRHHLSIQIQTILDTLNRPKTSSGANQYKFVLGGGKAAELYINPVLQNLLFKKVDYLFSHDFDLVVYRNDYQTTNDVWKPWGWLDTTGKFLQKYVEDWNRDNHPAVNDLLREVQTVYRNDFKRRELISHIRNIDIKNYYDCALLDLEIQNNQTFKRYTVLNNFTRIWKIKFALPITQKNKDGSTQYEEFDYIDIKNGIEERYLYRQGGKILEKNNMISFYGYPQSAFPKEYFWTRQERNEWNDVSIPVRPNSYCFIVDPYILYKEQLKLIGSRAEREEILGKSSYEILNNRLKSIGLTLPDGGSIDSNQKSVIKTQPNTYKKRLIRLYCLHTMICQLKRYNLDNGFHEPLTDSTYISCKNNMYTTLSITNFFQFFSTIPFNLAIGQTYTNWILKASATSKNLQSSEYELSPGANYFYLKTLFDNNLLCWYRINGKEGTLSATYPKSATSTMTAFNSLLLTNKSYCSNPIGLSSYLQGGATLTYQKTVDSWIQSTDQARAGFHSAIFTILALSYNRQTFWQAVQTSPKLTTWMPFIKNAKIYSYLDTKAPVNKNVTLKTYRFGYPMPVLFKPSDKVQTTLGLVDSLPIGQMVYTSSYLSTTIKNSGDLKLPTFTNVLETGHTLYEFELKGDGFLYFTYESPYYQTKQGSFLKDEHEVFIPIWTRFSVKKKAWRYIADINTKEGDVIRNYKLAFVITLKQEPETESEYNKDIRYIAPVSYPSQSSALVLPSSVSTVPLSLPAVPPPPPAPVLPTGNLPPGYNFRNAAADTGIPFATPPTPSLQQDFTDPAYIDTWITTNFPYNFASEQTPYSIQGLTTFLSSIGNARSDNSPYPFLQADSPSIANVIGDGSCLVHALLHSISRWYRYHPNKSLVGQAFRQHQMIKLARTYEDLRKIMDLTGSQAAWLGDTEMTRFQQKYSINILMHTLHQNEFSIITQFAFGNLFNFGQNPFTQGNLLYPDQPTIVLLNKDNNHYESCLYAPRYDLTPLEAIAIVSPLVPLVNVGGVVGPDPYVYPVGVGQGPSIPVLPTTIPQNSFQNWTLKYPYLFQSSTEFSRQRAPIPLEVKVTTDQFKTYRSTLLGGNFQYTYTNKTIEAFMIWVCQASNDLYVELSKEVPHLILVKSDPLEQQYLARAYGVVMRYKFWNTYLKPDLGIFRDIFQACSDFFAVIVDFSNETFPLIDTKTRLESNPGFAMFLQTDIIVKFYIIMELIEALRLALATDPSLNQITLPQTSPQFQAAFNNQSLGPKKLAHGEGYSFPPFPTLSAIETTKPYWDNNVVTMLCMQALLEEKVSTFAGGNRLKKTRRSKKKINQTRKH